MGISTILEGDCFGRLTVVKRAPKGEWKTKNSEWMCECICGVSLVVQSSNLRSGKTVSCGCYNKEQVKKRSTTHGSHSSPEYDAWQHMKSRCTNPNTMYYANYGGRGIRVCAEWLNSFEAFYRDVGPRPSDKHSLDRIDVNGDYVPENCRWATKVEQARNRTTTTYIRYNDSLVSLADAAELSGVSRKTVSTRLCRGWSQEALLLQPGQRPSLLPEAGE